MESLLEENSLVSEGKMQISSAPMERYLTMIYDEILGSSSVDEGVTSALMTALVCAIAREKRRQS